MFDEEGSLNLNPRSRVVMEDCYVEPDLAAAKPGERFQFVRSGYYCVDTKDSTKDAPVFNRIVEMKSSYKPEGK